jgi:hypothetical protein
LCSRTGDNFEIVLYSKLGPPTCLRDRARPAFVLPTGFGCVRQSIGATTYTLSNSHGLGLAHILHPFTLIRSYEELVLIESYPNALANITIPYMTGSITDNKGQRSLLAPTWFSLPYALINTRFSYNSEPRSDRVG